MTKATKAERRHAGLAYLRQASTLTAEQLIDVMGFSEGLNVSVGIAIASRGYWMETTPRVRYTLSVLETW